MTDGVILGVSCDYHDAAAALLVDGVVAAAAEEERFSRRKHDRDLPERAIASCLATAGVAAADLEAVVFYEKPLRVVGRHLAARQSSGPVGFGTWIREAPVLLGRNALVGYRIERALAELGAGPRVAIRYGEHHLSHAAAAYLPSPYDSAAVLTVDGVGEWSTASVAHGAGHRVHLLEELRYPSSLGLLYSLVTTWCGFEANDGEYKLMGLAPYGEPRHLDALRSVVDLRDDGSFTVDPRAVGWWSRRAGRFERLLGFGPRDPGEPLGERWVDLAASIQALTEEIVLRMAAHAHDRTGERALCLAGGVAHNSVAVGRLQREGPFDQVWVQPAAGDAGSAIGAALWYWHDELGHPRAAGSGPLGDRFGGALLGPAASPEEVRAWLTEQGIEHRRVDDDEALVREVAAALADGAIVGWCRGRMEFGPRALGARSILADPRSPDVHRTLNLQVKGRESFRPFAPSVRWEDAQAWFDVPGPLPYMTSTWPVADAQRVAVDHEPDDLADRATTVRSTIPACTHVDGSARVQTVHRELHGAYHALLGAFGELTGCPVLVNTSFNLAGEPIVASPADAARTAARAGIDLLVLEDCLVRGTDLPGWQPEGLAGGSADQPPGP